MRRFSESYRRPFDFVSSQEALDTSTPMGKAMFSDVYFNQKRTVALVHVNWWCGGLCGRPTWRAFEKGGDGVWQIAPWARFCPVVVERNPATILEIVATL